MAHEVVSRAHVISGGSGRRATLASRSGALRKLVATPIRRSNASGLLEAVLGSRSGVVRLPLTRAGATGASASHRADDSSPLTVPDFSDITEVDQHMPASSATSLVNRSKSVREWSRDALAVMGAVGVAFVAAMTVGRRFGSGGTPALLDPRFASIGASVASTDTPTADLHAARPAGGRFAAASLEASSKAGPMESAGENTTYRIVRMLSSRRTATKLFAIAAIIVPVMAIGGILHGRTTGQTIPESLYDTYTVVVNMPGADAVAADKPGPARAVLSLMYVCHLVLFATLLGIVIDDFTNMVNDLRSGKYKVCESGHTVVLNWNSQAPSLLRQMAVAREERSKGTFSKPVVIVSDVDKEEMDAAVAEALGAEYQLDVITRTACSYDVATLEGIHAGQAGQVIVLTPDGADIAELDSRLAATLGALEELGGGPGGNQNVVMQVTANSDSLPYVSAALSSLSKEGEPASSSFGVVPVNVGERLERLLAQCAVQPGIGGVYSSVLLQTRDSAEFYMKDLPKHLVGKEFADIRRSTSDAVVAGYSRKGELVVNPADDVTIEAGDRLLLLTGKEAVHFGRPHAPHALPQPSDVPQEVYKSHRATRRVVVLGWKPDADISRLAGGLGDFSTPGSECVVVSSEKPEGWKGKVGNSTFKLFKADAGDVEEWTKAITADTDAVILGPGLCDPDGSDDEVDAQVVANLLHLQDVVSASEGRTGPMHVVSTIRKPRTQQLCRALLSGRGLVTTDLMLPQELLGGIITQVAAQPDMVDVFTELVSPTATDELGAWSSRAGVGPEIVLHNPAFYRLPLGTPVNFGAVTEAARAAGDTVLGYIDASGAVITNPGPSHSLTAEVGTKLVCISNNYQDALAAEAKL